MSKEKQDAKFDQLKGSVKEFAGKVTGDSKTETEGSAEKTVGKAKELAADAKDKIEGVVSGIKKSLSKD